MNQQNRDNLEALLRRWSFSSIEQDLNSRSRSFWKLVRDHWMKFAAMLGKANALLLLTIVYILLIGPAALVLKIIRKDLLDRKLGKAVTYWQEKSQEPLTAERSRQPF